MKTVLKSEPPPACPLPKKKPATKTQRAIEVASDLWKRATNGRAKPTKPTSPACSPTPKPAPKKPIKPTKPKPCTGKKCRRENLEHDLTLNTNGPEGDNTSIDKRAIKRVGMDDAKVYSWGPRDEIETTGISVCSVLIVYTKSKVGMAHIPQGRIVGNRYMPGEDVVTELTNKLGTAFGSMSGATVVLYHHESLDQDRVKQISDWARAQNITPKIEVFSKTLPGSGTFNVSRHGDAWPPFHNPPL